VWICWAISKQTGESGFFEIDPDDLDVGDGEIDRGLDRLRVHLETGNWETEWERAVQRVSLPRSMVLFSEV